MQLRTDMEQNTNVRYFSQEKIEFDTIKFNELGKYCTSYFGALPQLSMFSWSVPDSFITLDVGQISNPAIRFDDNFDAEYVEYEELETSEAWQVSKAFTKIHTRDRCYHFLIIFAEKFSKKLAILTQNKNKLCNVLIITLVFEKKTPFFEKIVINCRKLWP
jgi:hypothetical protein